MNENLDKYDIIDLAWAAGLLEGEGSFTKFEGKWNRVTCASVDKDIIHRLKSIFNCGGISSNRTTVTGKTVYTYYVTKKEDADNIMLLVLPFMGKRRSEKIRELLNI